MSRSITRDNRGRDVRSMKLSATVKEAVADAEVTISQEEDSEARPGAPGPRTDQDRGAEQPDIGQRSADLRPRYSRIRRLVLFGAAPCLQPDYRAPVSHSPRTARVCACHDPHSSRW